MSPVGEINICTNTANITLVCLLTIYFNSNFLSNNHWSFSTQETHCPKRCDLKTPFLWRSQQTFGEGNV